MTVSLGFRSLPTESATSETAEDLLCRQQAKPRLRQVLERR